MIPSLYEDEQQYVRVYYQEGYIIVPHLLTAVWGSLEARFFCRWIDRPPPPTTTKTNSSDLTPIWGLFKKSSVCSSRTRRFSRLEKSNHAVVEEVISNKLARVCEIYFPECVLLFYLFLFQRTEAFPMRRS